MSSIKSVCCGHCKTLLGELENSSALNLVPFSPGPIYPRRGTPLSNHSVAVEKLTSDSDNNQHASETHGVEKEAGISSEF